MFSGKLAIGYLVPEFPGQTHNFFWREIQALRRLGIEVHLLSTRPPSAGLMSTSWGPEAISKTIYLYPLKSADLIGALGVLLRAGPAAWIRCLGGIAKAEGVTLKQRARMLGLTLMAAKLARIALVQGWRHVHVHSCADAANVALFARWLCDISYSLTLHNPLSVYGGNQRQKWRHASFGIVITQALLHEVHTTLRGNLPPRLEVAPMGVNVSVFRRTSPYRPYEGEGNLRVFCCARLNPAKGHRFLIEAVGQLRQEGMSITLEIAGEDDLGGHGHRIELEALIRSRGLQGQVKLLAAVPEEVVRERLMEAHVFALASLEEPLGVAIMEAMSMEVPVIATRAGGVPELVSDGLNGLLVRPGDSASIAQALKIIATDPRRARGLGESGRRKVADEFSSDRSAKAIANLILADVG